MGKLLYAACFSPPKGRCYSRWRVFQEKLVDCHRPLR